MVKPLQILLADDDQDDRFIFEMELNVIPVKTKLTMLEDGEKLMKYLYAEKKLPDILFLDLNMPRMRGDECLAEIKKSEKLRKLPVIILSTACNDQVTQNLYDTGSDELQQLLGYVLSLLQAKKLELPAKNKFMLEFKDLTSSKNITANTF
jgi:CheY-like chemotaxis protein